MDLLQQARRHRLKTTLALGVAALAVAATATATILSSSSSGTSTPASAAKAPDRCFGTAVTAGKLTDPTCTGILDHEFSMVTPENEMKRDSAEPANGSYSFGSADKIVSHALARGQRVRGHTLVRHSQLPSWVSSASRNVLGDGFIEEAFRTAHAADPAARLCHNDYNIENRSSAKSQGVYAVVKDFKARGVPIDCSPPVPESRCALPPHAARPATSVTTRTTTTW
jgi:endo-1,4-beta-xylanase